MLPNRTYNELNESCFSQTELSEEAKLRAAFPPEKTGEARFSSPPTGRRLLPYTKKCRKGRSNGAPSKHCFAIFI